MSYYKYLVNLKIKSLSKQYTYCFFFNLVHLNINMRVEFNKDLIYQLKNNNWQLLFLKNLSYKIDNFFINSGEYLLIYSNKLINIQIFEQYLLHCTGIMCKHNCLNMNIFAVLHYWENFFVNNFMFFISYFMFFVFVYIESLLVLKKKIFVCLKKIKL